MQTPCEWQQCLKKLDRKETFGVIDAVETWKVDRSADAEMGRIMARGFFCP